MPLDRMKKDTEIINNDTFLKAEIELLADLSYNAKYYTGLRIQNNENNIKLWEKFWKDWSIIRTIPGKENQEYRTKLIREILATNINSLSDTELAQKVDSIAISNPVTRKGKTNKSIPTSLVSKSLFMLHPHKLPPYDKYARETLCKSVGIKLDNDQKDRYFRYFELFLSFKKKHQREVNRRLNESLYKSPYFAVISKDFSKSVLTKSFITMRMLDKLLWLYYKTRPMK